MFCGTARAYVAWIWLPELDIGVLATNRVLEALFQPINKAYRIGREFAPTSEERTGRGSIVRLCFL